jgi:hypothetical protein
MPTTEKNFVYDTERWNAVALRDGDIIISTPAKCGTTWTQMLVALLIFDTPDLPAPLARLSPWVDMNTRPVDDVVAELEAQSHRRFMKSHAAIDALPQDGGVTYISVGRDPRDVALSWAHHYWNMNLENFFNERAQAVGLDDLADMPAQLPPPQDRPLGESFWAWIEGDEGMGSAVGLVAHLRGFWDRRNDPNVILLHYADLQKDLVGQMAELAERLGIERSRERLEQLAPAASFAEMKASAERVAPNADQTFWKSTSDFFHKGTSGQWHDVMTDADLPRYERRMTELVPDDDFGRWLHQGTLS